VADLDESTTIIQEEWRRLLCRGIKQQAEVKSHRPGSRASGQNDFLLTCFCMARKFYSKIFWSRGLSATETDVLRPTGAGAPPEDWKGTTYTLSGVPCWEKWSSEGVRRSAKTATRYKQIDNDVKLLQLQGLGAKNDRNFMYGVKVSVAHQWKALDHSIVDQKKSWKKIQRLKSY